MNCLITQFRKYWTNAGPYLLGYSHTLDQLSQNQSIYWFQRLVGSIEPKAFHCSNSCLLRIKGFCSVQNVHLWSVAQAMFTFPGSMINSDYLCSSAHLFVLETAVTCTLNVTTTLSIQSNATAMFPWDIVYSDIYCAPFNKKPSWWYVSIRAKAEVTNSRKNSMSKRGCTWWLVLKYILGFRLTLEWSLELTSSVVGATSS